MRRRKAARASDSIEIVLYSERKWQGSFSASQEITVRVGIHGNLDGKEFGNGGKLSLPALDVNVERKRQQKDYLVASSSNVHWHRYTSSFQLLIIIYLCLLLLKFIWLFKQLLNSCVMSSFLFSHKSCF